MPPGYSKACVSSRRSKPPLPGFFRAWLLAACAIGAPSAWASGACKIGKAAEFPITMENSNPVMTAKINDRDVRLTIDSGAFFNMLSPASAARLGLSTHSAPFGLYVRGAGGDATSVSVATVKVFTLAGLSIHNADFLVGGTDWGSGSTSVGLLGQNLLRNWDVEYDFSQGVVRLWKAEDCRKAVLAYWVMESSQPYSVIEIEPIDRASLHTIGSVFVNGTEIRAMFDTGASTSILSLRAAARAGVKPDSPGTVDAGISYGIGRKTYRTYIAPFSAFKLGDGEEIKNTRLRIGDIDAGDAEMLIGADFFLSHRIYVANSQNKLYLTYNGGPVFNLSTAKYQQSAAAPSSAADQPPAADKPADSGVGSAAGTPAESGDAADLSRRGQALAARRDFAHALADLDRACDLAPNEAEYRYQRAMIHWQMQQGELALTDLDRAIELKPDDVQALLARAELRLQRGDRPGAVADLDAADPLIPKQASERLRMAALYERADVLDSAIRQFDSWIDSHDVDAMLPEALNRRCWARALLGSDLDAALKDCSAALKRAQKASAFYAKVADSRGLVLLRLGKYDKSMEDYDASLKISPRNAWSLYGRGIDKTRLKKSAEGQADMDAAAKVWPKVAEEFERRGIVP